MLAILLAFTCEQHFGYCQRECSLCQRVRRLLLTQDQLQSEHDAAFSEASRDRIARGQHYHDEAMRLWALEEKRLTLTNIQALCVLALEYVTHLPQCCVQMY